MVDSRDGRPSYDLGVDAPENLPLVRLEKVKRPGGVSRFDVRLLAEDGDGTWLWAPAGSSWAMAHDSGTLPVAVVALLARGRPWVAWWVDDPLDRRVEIDVCLPPERTDTGWRYVDLELDPVRHELDQRVEIEDWDEFEESVREGWMTADDATLARSTAEELAEALRRHDAPWHDQGWRRLASLTRPGSTGTPIRVDRPARPSPGGRDS